MPSGREAGESAFGGVAGKPSARGQKGWGSLLKVCSDNSFVM